MGSITEEDLSHYWTNVSEMMYVGEHEYYHRTKCMAPCSYYLYETEKEETYYEKEMPGLGNDSTVMLYLFHLKQPKISVREEYYVNSMNSLLGNVGGMIGILLGTSILGLVDLIISVVIKREKNGICLSCH